MSSTKTKSQEEKLIDQAVVIAKSIDVRLTKKALRYVDVSRIAQAIENGHWDIKILAEEVAPAPLFVPPPRGTRPGWHMRYK